MSICETLGLDDSKKKNIITSDSEEWHKRDCYHYAPNESN